MTAQQKQKARIKELIRLSNEAVANGLPPDPWVVEYRKKNNEIKAKWKSKQPKKDSNGQFKEGCTPANKLTPQQKIISIDKAKKIKKEWTQKNKESIAIRLKKWREENRDRTNDYKRNKRNIDPSFKIACNLRKRLSFLLSLHNAKKSKQTLHLLGCTMPEFIAYLQLKFDKGMSFENYGQWHIDHILPCSKFDLTKEEEQAICFHYTNLQPLWALDNRIKSNKAA